LHRIIESAADWRGPDMLHAGDWIYELSKADVAEIETALKAAKAMGLSFETLTRENFVLPNFSRVMAYALDMLENGPGIYHLRGFPAGRYDKDDLRLIYWGLGLYLGTAVSQSKMGDLLGDVRDFGVDIASPEGRGYKSRQQLSYHCDSCDVVGLMVLRAAKEGGLSIIASSLAVRNEIARTRPDLLDVLYQPYPWSWNTQEPPGEKPWYMQPLFSQVGDKFSCRYIRMQVLNSQRFPDAPRLTDQQREAMELIDKLASSDEFRMFLKFEPGDVQFLNNHVALHSRTEFHDYPEEDRKRHLLRMWLSVPNSRELAPGMGVIYRDRRAGALRGGFPSRTGQHLYHTVHAPAND
jgi:hypothetical protein